MKTLVSLLANQNSIQRVGSFLTFAAFCILLILHNPIDGYNITYEADYSTNSYEIVLRGYSEHPLAECYRFASILNDSDSSTTRVDAIQKMMDLSCHGKHLYPLKNWTTNSPIIEWFGSVVHVLWATFILCLLYIGCLFTFRAREQGL